MQPVDRPHGEGGRRPTDHQSHRAGDPLLAREEQRTGGGPGDGEGPGQLERTQDQRRWRPEPEPALGPVGSPVDEGVAGGREQAQEGRHRGHRETHPVDGAQLDRRHRPQVRRQRRGYEDADRGQGAG
jgi:hypothetical protein